MRTQEMEAYRLEYDCSVKYEEHQQKQETSMQSSELTTNISKTIQTLLVISFLVESKHSISSLCPDLTLLCISFSYPTATS